MTLRQILSLAGMVAPPVYFLTILIIGIIRPGYHFTTQMISQLTQPTDPYQHTLTAAFTGYNTLAIMFAARFALLVKDSGKWPSLGYAGVGLVTLLGVAGAIRVAFFPMDPLGAPVTLHGMLHLGLAGLSSVTAVTSLLVFGIWFRGTRILGQFADYTTASGWNLFGAILVTGLAWFLSFPWIGMIEKLAVFIYLQWMFFISFQLFQRR